MRKSLNILFFLVNVTLVVQYLTAAFLAVGISRYEGSWLEHNNIPLEDTMRVYITTIYFIVTTISTLGYGDIVPWAIYEFYLMIIIELLGVAFYPFMMHQLREIYQLRIAHVDDLVNLRTSEFEMILVKNKTQP